MQNSLWTIGKKGENAACQYWAKARVVGKEGDAPWNKLHHRIIPLWKDFGLKNYVSQTVHSGTINDTLVCQLPYNAQIMPYMELEAEKAHSVRYYYLQATIKEEAHIMSEQNI